MYNKKIMKLFKNSWIVGIGTIIIGGIILYLLFGNGNSYNNYGQQRITYIEGDLNIKNAVTSINGEVNIGNCGSISGSGTISGSGSIGCLQSEREEVYISSYKEMVENLLIIMPDCKIALIDKIIPSQNITFANCLVGNLDCVIFDRFKIKELPININGVYLDEESEHCIDEGKIKLDIINKKLLSVEDV